MKIHLIGIKPAEHTTISEPHVTTYEHGTIGVSSFYYADNAAQSVVMELTPAEALKLVARIINAVENSFTITPR